MSEYQDAPTPEADAILKRISEAIYAFGDNTTDPGRPFDGQPHTDAGERGKTMVEGLRMRDIADCILLGFLYSMEGFGYSIAESGTATYNDVYVAQEADPDFDPLAVIQNAMCQIEKRMGIYPNVPKLTPEAPDDPT